MTEHFRTQQRGNKSLYKYDLEDQRWVSQKENERIYIEEYGSGRRIKQLLVSVYMEDDKRKPEILQN